MRTYTIKVREIAVDGLPPRDALDGLDARLIGRIAFLFDGNIVSGWPLERERFPDLYTEEAIYKRSGLAQSIGLSQEERNQILDMCGRKATLWEADEDVGRHGVFSGVTHWVEFPAPLWDIEREDA